MRVTFRQNSQKMPTVIVIVKNLRSYVTISGSSSFPVAILDSQAMINDANFKLDFCSFLVTGTGNFCGESVGFVKNNRKMKYLSENIAFCLIFLLDKVTGLRDNWSPGPAVSRLSPVCQNYSAASLCLLTTRSLGPPPRANSPSS